jgi:hypothetical protein
MRNIGVIITMTFLAIAVQTPAFAQRAPAPGMWAISGAVGASVPKDASLDNGVDLAVNIENYLSSRVSIRGQLGGSSWNIIGRAFTGDVKPLRLDGNLVYNWEGGAWHPYVTAGVGMYDYRSSLSGNVSGSDTKAGIDAGGGIEYFFRRRTTLTGEVLYHGVGAFNGVVTTYNSGSFWTFDIGLKAYLRR